MVTMKEVINNIITTLIIIINNNIITEIMEAVAIMVVVDLKEEEEEEVMDIVIVEISNNSKAILEILLLIHNRLIKTLCKEVEVRVITLIITCNINIIINILDIICNNNNTVPSINNIINRTIITTITITKAEQDLICLLLHLIVLLVARCKCTNLLSLQLLL
jgi:hypothetical protein